RYLALQAPQTIVQILPIAMLLATFLALGQLNKFGELAAMRAAGLSLLRILRPIFLLAGLMTVSAFLLNELVVPGVTRVRDQVLREQIERVRPEQPTERADVTYLGEGGRIYIMRLYLIRERRMHEVSLQEFRNGELWRRIDADEASWNGTGWTFSS